MLMMESLLTGDSLAIAISLGGCAWALLPFSAEVPALLLAAILVIHILSLYVETSKIQQTYLNDKAWKLRPKCGRGTYITVLVPLAIILSIYYSHNGVYCDGLHLLCMGLLIQSAIIHGNTCGRQYNSFKRIFEVLMPCSNVGALYIVGMVSAKQSEVTLVHVLVLVGSVLQSSVIRWLPESLSPGEGSVVSQGMLTMCFSGLLHPSTTSKHINIFLRVAGSSCMLVVFILFMLPSLQNTVGFYAIGVTVAVGFAMPLIYATLNQNFILWIYAFVTHNNTRICLFIYWAVCCSVAAVLVIINAYRLNESSLGNNKPEQSASKDSIKTKTEKELKHRKESKSISGKRIKASESKPSRINVRKHFHIFAIVVFLPGLIWDKEMLLTAATCAIIVFIMLETIRKCRVWPLGESLEVYLRVFVDSRDSGPVILTHIYLILGCTLPLWLHPDLHIPGVQPCLVSGLLSLGVGDTAASVFGTKIGKHKWPGTSKTVEGTLASILCQLIATLLLDQTGIVWGIDWLHMTVAIVMTSLLEAFTSQIDNLVLPLFMYILLV